jgi:nucleotide-binding universal stress UspA family protein
MRTNDLTAPLHGIIVGVDGSQPSVDALRWAAREAELTGADLHAVTSWQSVPSYGYGPVIDTLDLSDGARESLRTAVRQAFGTTPPARLTLHVGEGHPAAVLLTAAAEADLLVVGSRGHGTLVGAMLGSVSHYVAAHAVCPVVVVRHADAAAPPTADHPARVSVEGDALELSTVEHGTVERGAVERGAVDQPLTPAG